MLPGLKIRNEGGGETQKRKTPRGLIEVVLALLDIVNLYAAYVLKGMRVWMIIIGLYGRIIYNARFEKDGEKVGVTNTPQ
jgi:hypothetical protein